MRTIQGTPDQSSAPTTGASAAMARPAVAHQAILLTGGSIASGDSTATPNAMQFRISTRKISCQGLLQAKIHNWRRNRKAIAARKAARTRAEREKTGDPRLSVEERYTSKQAYLDKVEAAAGDLVKERFLLQRDVPLVVARSRRKASVAPTRNRKIGAGMPPMNWEKM